MNWLAYDFLLFIHYLALLGSKIHLCMYSCEIHPYAPSPYLKYIKLLIDIKQFYILILAHNSLGINHVHQLCLFDHYMHKKNDCQTPEFADLGILTVG